MPSLSKLLNVNIPQKIDGQSMLQTLTGKSNKGRTEFIVEASGRLALLKEGWSLLPPYKGPVTNETGNELGNLADFELFNLQKDKSQSNNLVPKMISKFESMKKTFLKITKGYYNPNAKQEVLK
jgi:arylsulfatase A-like enzyme